MCGGKVGLCEALREAGQKELLAKNVTVEATTATAQLECTHQFADNHDVEYRLRMNEGDN